VTHVEPDADTDEFENADIDEFENADADEFETGMIPNGSCCSRRPRRPCVEGSNDR